MAFDVNHAPGQNLHVNYEPTDLGGLKEAPRSGADHQPMYEGRLVRQKIDRENNFQQAGDLWREMTEEYKTELVNNVAGALANCIEITQQKRIDQCTQADPAYGQRVKDALAHKTGMNKEAAEASAVHEAGGDGVGGYGILSQLYAVKGASHTAGPSLRLWVCEAGPSERNRVDWWEGMSLRSDHLSSFCIRNCLLIR